MALPIIPEWVGTTLLGAVIAALGFVGKQIYELWVDLRKAHAIRLASLTHLSVYLTASRTLFLVQKHWADSLMEQLWQKHPDAISATEGFEVTFVKLYNNFSPEETDLHNQIRDWTVHGLRPVNEALLNWLENDTLFKTTYIKASDKKKRLLAEKLIQLHAHLLLWRCKYDAWIPAYPKHSLVYLADEARHGIGFPSGLDDLIQDVMHDLKKSAPKLPVVIEKSQNNS